MGRPQPQSSRQGLGRLQACFLWRRRHHLRRHKGRQTERYRHVAYMQGRDMRVPAHGRVPNLWVYTTGAIFNMCFRAATALSMRSQPTAIYSGSSDLPLSVRGGDQDRAAQRSLPATRLPTILFRRRGSALKKLVTAGAASSRFSHFANQRAGRCPIAQFVTTNF